jgi:hypothetical protein
VAPVPVGFPFELQDLELKRALSEMLQGQNWPGFDEFSRLLPELKLQLVASGLQELQRRDNAKTAARSLLVACTALVVSIAPLAVAVTVAVVS